MVLDRLLRCCFGRFFSKLWPMPPFYVFLPTAGARLTRPNSMGISTLYLAPDLIGPPSGIARYGRMVIASLESFSSPLQVVAFADALSEPPSCPSRSMFRARATSYSSCVRRIAGPTQPSGSYHKRPLSLCCNKLASCATDRCGHGQCHLCELTPGNGSPCPDASVCSDRIRFLRSVTSRHSRRRLSIIYLLTNCVFSTTVLIQPSPICRQRPIG